MAKQTQTQNPDEAAFLNALASCADACAEMDFSDDGWKPPVGTYDVSIDAVKTGTKTADGVTNLWIKPVFSIIAEGEYAGKSFSDFMYIPQGTKELTPALRQLLRLATCIAGREVRNPVEAVGICQKAVGSFLTLEVFQTVAKKGKSAGKTYTNIRFLAPLTATAA